MTPFEIIDKIARGDVFVISVTFPEGLTFAEMAKIFESHGLGTAESFVKAARDPAPIHEIDPAARDLEGYLFPETYALPRHTDAVRLTRMMVARFEKVFTPELRQAAAARTLTVRQAVTLASIVEKETAKAEERPLVAAVYTTRLRIGMPMQCDPTVIYGLVKAGRYDGNIHKVDLSFDSPYNTYRYPGLPPDRSPRPAARRSKPPCILPPPTTCTSSAATTGRTSSRAPSRSTTGMFRSFRFSIFAIAVSIISLLTAFPVAEKRQSQRRARGRDHLRRSADCRRAAARPRGEP